MKKKLPINQLALNCYLTQSTVQNLIGAKSKNPKLCTIFLICHGLDISLSNFLMIMFFGILK